MLDLPIPIPTGSSYEKLGIGPEASPNEISEAAREAKSRLEAEQRETQSKLQQVYEQIEGLEAVLQQVAKLQAQGKDAVSAELHTANQALLKLEVEASRIAPQYRLWRERAGQFEAEINAIQNLKLENANDRLEHDRAFPPLELLKLASDERDQFATKAELMLPLVRKELGTFLMQRGVEVFHPSDLTREDFSDDFTYLKDLDGPA